MSSNYALICVKRTKKGGGHDFFFRCDPRFGRYDPLGFARASPLRHHAGMLGLTDTQLAAVIDGARTLPAEKRDVYLRRIASMLTMRGYGRFTDTDVADVAQLALTGLAQQPAA